MSSSVRNITSIVNHTTYPTFLPTQTLALDEPCVFTGSTFYILRTILFTIGCVSNTVFIVVFWRRKELRTLTFLIISSLAFVDCIFNISSMLFGLSVGGFINHKTMKIPEYCPALFRSKAWSDILNTVQSSSYICSSWHIILLSVFRYIILVHPLSAQVRLSRRHVFISVATVWLLSVAFELVRHILPEGNNPLYESVNFVAVYPLTVTVTIFIHLLKIWKLRKQSFGGQNLPLKTMNIFQSVVLTLFIILPLPCQIVKFLRVNEYIKPSYMLWSVTGLFLFLQNCINPFLYIFMSKTFRQAAMKVYQCPCHVNDREQTISTVSTKVSTTI